MRRMLIAAGVTLLAAMPVSAQVTLGGYTYYQWAGNGHWYALSQGAVGWGSNFWAAEAEADALGGNPTTSYLASIHSAAEAQFLSETFGHDDSWWIGLYQTPGSATPQSGWVWTSGEAVTYTNWDGLYEPNDYETPWEDGEEDFAVTASYTEVLGQWNDIPGTQGDFIGIMEFETLPASTVTPEPVTLTLLGTGMAGIAAARRRRRANARS